MRVSVLVDFHFQLTPDGTLWAATAYKYPFWQRYLQTFDQVTIVARNGRVAEPGLGFEKANGPGVDFMSLPDYRGPWQYAVHAREFRQGLRSALARSTAVIMRAPSQVANAATSLLVRAGRPFGLEVCGDPWEALAPNCVRCAFLPAFRWNFASQMRRQCKRAQAVMYVTSSALQSRYPTRAPAFAASDAQLSSEWFDQARTCKAPWTALGSAQNPAKVVFVGSLQQMYKGVDVLLEALRLCVMSGLYLSLRIVGDGQYRASLERLANVLGLREHTTFVGQVTSAARIRAELTGAHLFVLPSRTEGLPRALLEAMACGLPCIGTNVGGVPELLPAHCLARPGDHHQLATIIDRLVRNPDLMRKCSQSNAAKAWEFRDEHLSPRRTAFYSCLEEITEKWSTRVLDSRTNA